LRMARLRYLETSTHTHTQQRENTHIIIMSASTSSTSPTTTTTTTADKRVQALPIDVIVVVAFCCCCCCGRCCWLVFSTAVVGAMANFGKVKNLESSSMLFSCNRPTSGEDSKKSSVGRDQSIHVINRLNVRGYYRYSARDNLLGGLNGINFSLKVEYLTNNYH